MLAPQWNSQKPVVLLHDVSIKNENNSNVQSKECTVATKDNLMAKKKALTDIDAIPQAFPFSLLASLLLHLLVVWQVCHSL